MGLLYNHRRHMNRFQGYSLGRKIIVVLYSIYFQVFKFFWTYWAGYLLAMTSLISLMFPTRVKKAMQYFFVSLWARGLIFFGGFRYHVTVSKNVDFRKTYIYIGNHSSSLDIYIYQTVIRTFVNWMAKRSLFDVPFLGTAMWLLGHIPVFRDESFKNLKKTLSLGAKRIRAGYSLCIFPEGTRSYDGKMLPFKKGAFALAKMTKTDIVPVVIKNAWKIAPKGEWLTDIFVPLEIKILDPLDYSDKDIMQKTHQIMQDECDYI